VSLGGCEALSKLEDGLNAGLDGMSGALALDATARQICDEVIDNPANVNPLYKRGGVLLTEAEFNRFQLSTHLVNTGKQSRLQENYRLYFTVEKAKDADILIIGETHDRGYEWRVSQLSAGQRVKVSGNIVRVDNSKGRACIFVLENTVPRTL